MLRRQEGPGNEGFRSRGAPVNDQHRPRGRRTMIDRRPYPVSGAWRPGDDPGLRRFLTIAVDRPFALDRGGRLTDVDIAYETLGELDATASNAAPRLPRVDRRQPRGRAGRTRPPDARVVGGRRRAGAADRHRPLLRRLRQRRSGAARARPVRRRSDPDDRPAVRLDVPRHHHPGHGPGAGPPGRPPGDRALAVGARAARWAACRCSSGASPTRSGCGRSSPSPPARRPRRSRSPGARSGGGRSGSTPAGAAATTTTPSPATVPTRGWPSPAWWPR